MWKQVNGDQILENYKNEFKKMTLFKSLNLSWH